MKQTIRMFSIGKGLLALCPLLLPPVLLASCSSDNDAAEAEGAGRNAVITQAVPSAAVQDFFSVVLPPERGWAPFFDDGRAYSNPEWSGNVCKLVNSKEELKAIYHGIKKLPDIDFTTQTLVIGRQERHVDGIDSLQLMSSATGYELLVNAHVQKGLAPFNPVLEHFYFWGLYPKLEQKALSVSVSIRETGNGVPMDAGEVPLPGKCYLDSYMQNWSSGFLKEGDVVCEFRNDGRLAVVNCKDDGIFLATGIYPYVSDTIRADYGHITINGKTFYWDYDHQADWWSLYYGEGTLDYVIYTFCQMNPD